MRGDDLRTESFGGLHVRHASSLITLLIGLLGAASMAFAAEQAPQSTAQAASEEALARQALSGTEAAPIIVWNRTLAVMRAPYGASSAADRAAAATKRIEAILDDLDPDAVSTSFSTIGADSGVVVQAGEDILFGLLPGDLPQGSANTLDAAGPYVAGEVKRMLEERIEQRRTPQLILNSVYALLGILIYLALVVAVLRVRHRVLSHATFLVQDRAARLAFTGFDPRPAAVLLLRWAIRLTAFAIVLAATYVVMTFVLGRFPYTRPWAATLGGYIVDTVSGVLTEPAPRVLKTSLSDFYIEYELVAYAAPGADRAAVMSVLHANILDAFNEHHVQIMSPHFEGQPDRAIVVPPEKWQSAPAEVA